MSTARDRCAVTDDLRFGHGIQMIGSSGIPLRRSIAAMALSVALATGCASAPGPSVGTAQVSTPSPTVVVTPSPIPSPPPIPTPSPTPTPTASPAPSAQALCAKPGATGATGCPLSAGTYTAAPFDPGFRFTIGDGWSNFIADPGAGNLINNEETAGFGWGTGMHPEGEPAIDSVDVLVAFFAAHQGLTASDPAPVTIGGISGRSIDLTIKRDDVYFYVRGSVWQLSRGFKVRAIGLDVGGTVVLFVIEVSDPDDFDAEMAAAQPILDSIVWE